MSNCRNLKSCTQHELQIRKHTLADALFVIENKFQMAAMHSPSVKRLLRNLRATGVHISAMLHLPLQSIYLDDLVNADADLIGYIEGLDINRQSAVQYSCNLHKILDRAHELLGWTSSAYELHKSWVPIRLALKGKSKGCTGIIEFAIKHNRTPKGFNQKLMDAWKQHMFGMDRSLLTVQVEECHFRTRLRRAQMESHFPRFKLVSKNPPQYRCRLKDPVRQMDLPDIPEPLRSEILEIIRWKTLDEDVDDRDAELLIRPVSGERLLKTFVELYSYATKILGLGEISDLAHLLTEQIISGFIAWQQVVDDDGKPRSKDASIRSNLGSICYLTETYPKLKGGDYSFFRQKLTILRVEKSGQVQARKLDGIPDFESVASISQKILALRNGPGSLSEIEVAFLYHDALLFLTSCVNPHRSRNICEANVGEHGRLNIFETQITAGLLSHMKLPAWAKELRDKDRRTKFLVYHYVERDTKAGQEVWELFPQEALGIFKEYVGYYRPLILNRFKSKATSLFLARNGNPLTQKSLLDLIARTSVRYTGKRMTVKLFRDLVAAHMLATGSTLDEVAERLWHLDPCTTTVAHYIGCYNASDTVQVLEEELPGLAA